MTLIDTSIWIGHLRAGDDRVRHLLETLQVLMHPFVLGEVALGSLSGRKDVLSRLAKLPMPAMARPAEVLLMIERDGLAGAGIGYVDVHLLASAKLSGAKLWTHDTRLHAAARRLALDGSPVRPLR